jgi:hypothetical protein
MHLKQTEAKLTVLLVVDDQLPSLPATPPSFMPISSRYASSRDERRSWTPLLCSSNRPHAEIYAAWACS